MRQNKTQMRSKGQMLQNFYFFNYADTQIDVDQAVIDLYEKKEQEKLRQ